MKKVIFSLALFLTCSLLGYAQKGISYQAVILDPMPIEIPGQDLTGQPFLNGAVSLKFKIFSSNLVQEFEEVHATQTDAYGMVNVLIGSVSQGAFSSLVWDSKQKSLQVLVSFDQGGTYTKVSEQQLTYNPYAIYAETAGKLGGTLGIAAGGTGATTAANARANLGLGNVDNTSDANKPISTATQTALDTKSNAADVTTSLGLKEDVSNKANTPLGSSTTLYPTQNAVKTYVDAQIASATIADADGSTKGKIQLAGDLAGTAAAPTVPGLALKADAAAVNAALNLKANAVDVANELALKANSSEIRTLLREKEIVENKSINVVADADSDSKYPTVKSIKNYVDTQVAGATIADADASTKGKIQLAGDLAGTAAAPRVPGLALKADATAVATSLGLKEDVSNKANTPLGSSTSLYPTQNAVKTYVDAQVAGATIADANASTKGKIQLAGDLGGTAAAPTVPGLAAKADAAAVNTALNLKANTADITTALATKANSSSLSTVATSGDYNDLSNKPSFGLPIASASTLGGVKVGSNLSIDGGGVLSADLSAANISGTLAVGKGGTGATTLTGYVKGTGTTAMTASATIPVADVTGAAPLASPTFTGTLTSPIYASTPQALTDAGVISWNPANGLNASVTLAGNRTLSFSATPAAGAYGTLVVTQDAIGGRTLTLPSTTNKVLGSTSTTTIALSAAAGAKDIINFYYDGTNCYWNVGQGYGTAATAATTNLASSVSGILAVANGGTGSANQNFVDISTAQAVAGTKSFSSSMAVGTAVAPVSSAVMEVASTTKGFLPPRMTAAQRDAISAPATGLVLWCTNCSINGELQVFNGSLWTNAVGGAAQAAFSVGTPYGGGIVAYILQPGDPGYDPAVLHGLIATVANLSTSARWTSGEIPFSGAIGTAIGTGNQNTIDIVAGDPTAGLAARLCSDLVQGGYSDWYLPSTNELSNLYLNRVAIGGFTQNWYWSSTKQPAIEPQFPGKYALYVSFYTSEAGVVNYHFTTTTCAVRAVRSF